MATLGFGGGECGAVLRVLAFMLKLGNVRFEPQHNIDGTIGTRIDRPCGECPPPGPGTGYSTVPTVPSPLQR